MTFKRVDRIAEVIQRKLAELISREIDDPRLPSLITISAVKVSPDLSHARIYFTILEDNQQQTADILNAASNYLRGFLAKSLKLRKTPNLRFIYDESLAYARHLNQLIEDANQNNNENQS